MEQRRFHRCALPDFPQARWGPPQRPRKRMGSLTILGQPEAEGHEDGCPGAWYRCGFVLSLHKYERLLTENGFSENLLTSRSHDRLLLEALAYYEAEKMRARARDNEVIFSKN